MKSCDDISWWKPLEGFVPAPAKIGGKLGGNSGNVRAIPGKYYQIKTDAI